MCPAIHISSRSWLRSSSTHEPSDPPPKVVSWLQFTLLRFTLVQASVSVLLEKTSSAHDHQPPPPPPQTERGQNKLRTLSARFLARTEMLSKTSQWWGRITPRTRRQIGTTKVKMRWEKKKKKKAGGGVASFFTCHTTNGKKARTAALFTPSPSHGSQPRERELSGFGTAAQQLPLTRASTDGSREPGIPRNRPGTPQVTVSGRRAAAD